MFEFPAEWSKTLDTSCSGVMQTETGIVVKDSVVKELDTSRVNDARPIDGLVTQLKDIK